MRGTLLPAARDVSAQADAQLTAASGQATGLPLALILLVAAVPRSATCSTARSGGCSSARTAGSTPAWWWRPWRRWCRCSGWPSRSTVARGDLLQARDHGSAPVAALARADIAALQARADESLTLIDAGGDDSFEADFETVEHRLGPGPGTLLTDAVTAARGSPGAGSASAAATAATAWYASAPDGAVAG